MIFHFLRKILGFHRLTLIPVVSNDLFQMQHVQMSMSMHSDDSLPFLSFCTYIRQRIDQWASSSPNRFNSLSLASFFDIRTPFESVSDRVKSYVSLLEYVPVSPRKALRIDSDMLSEKAYSCFRLDFVQNRISFCQLG